MVGKSSSFMGVYSGQFMVDWPPCSRSGQLRADQAVTRADHLDDAMTTGGRQL
jgi:hypothetical protein